MEVSDIPKSKPGKNQVLVVVHAASVNPFDLAVRSGGMRSVSSLQLPFTLGGDFAGVVLETGEDVVDFKIGDEVYGSAIVFGSGSGAFAQEVSVNIANCALKPKGVNMQEAAALPLVGSSAVQALEEHIKLKNNQKILIHGKLPRAKSPRSCSLSLYERADDSNTRKYVFSRIQPRTDSPRYSASEYKNQKFEDILSDFDAVYDTVGGDVTERSFRVLKKGGILVSMKGQPDEKLAQKYQVFAIGQFTKINAEHLKRLSELVDADVVKVHVDKIFTLDAIKDAFEYQEIGHPQGKVVVKIGN
ncbi:MAG: NADPH:quinone reductase Zn-dependent oxidoreductase [Candidatus Curtissbacteria bacterium GW2011_GWA2_40_31]|nr:MAG: NADPH:quinone reductase Zn-dependent oxidoreductase [Candidatus Curtissbacteria bacterium GW2011_GWA2_40_31]